MATTSDDLSPEARAIDDTARDLISTLTDKQVSRRRRWYRGGTSTSWWLLVLVLFIVVGGVFLFGMLSDDGRESTPPTVPNAAAAGGRWYFSADENGQGLYTIDLLGDGTNGTIEVIEDTTEQGTYTWVGDALTIDFTRVMRMTDGFEFAEASQFECSGTPDASTLTCVYHRETWSYDGEDGLARGAMTDWPSHAERRG